MSTTDRIGIIEPGSYSCNGSPSGCEGQRFGGCRYYEAARIRAEALRPDREKLLGVAAAVRGIVIPRVSAEADTTTELIAEALDDCANAIRDIVEGMN